MNHFPGRLAIQQRVLPNYRAAFFDLLASLCDGGMSLFAGLPRRSEGITTISRLQNARVQLGRNVHVFRGNLTLCYQFGLIDWLRGWNPDVLVVEANARCLSTPAAIRWMHRHGKSVIGWGLGAPPPSSPALAPGASVGQLPQHPQERLRIILERIQSGLWGRLGGGLFRQMGRLSFLNQFDALIAYSQRGADEYAALGFPREKIFVAHNAVSHDPESVPDDRPWTIDRPTILFVGRLQGRKRVDDLLKACVQLESKPRLLIVGDGPERLALESLAKEMYPSAEFVGAKHGAELKPYFTEADLFVLPGTGGLAIQEAMSYGLPVIVAQGDGTQDDLVRKGNGWQIPPGNFEALVSALKDALSDVVRLRRMGEESYRIVKEEINIERMAETFVNVLNLLANK